MRVLTSLFSRAREGTDKGEGVPPVRCTAFGQRVIMWATANEPNMCISPKGGEMEKTMFNFDNRYTSERGQYSPSFTMVVKPEKVYFNGHKMPVTGEVRGLKRNKIPFRAVVSWNKDFTDGVIESVKLECASRKDKANTLVLGDIINLVNEVINMYLEA